MLQGQNFVDVWKQMHACSHEQPWSNPSNLFLRSSNKLLQTSKMQVGAVSVAMYCSTIGFLRWTDHLSTPSFWIINLHQTCGYSDSQGYIISILQCPEMHSGAWPLWIGVQNQKKSTNSLSNAKKELFWIEHRKHHKHPDLHFSDVQKPISARGSQQEQSSLFMEQPRLLLQHFQPESTLQRRYKSFCEFACCKNPPTPP